MAKYSREQSTVVALWVLALQQRDEPKAAIQGATAPRIIVDVVNKLGEEHTSDSILLHTHGYDRLLMNRQIDKTVTELQRQIADELVEQGVISKRYDA
jgi:hypothetical protein